MSDQVHLRDYVLMKHHQGDAVERVPTHLGTKEENKEITRRMVAGWSQVFEEPKEAKPQPVPAVVEGGK